VLGEGVPTPIVDDDRLGPGPGAAQAVQVLVMVKRITTSPPDLAGVGIGISFSIVVE